MIYKCYCGREYDHFLIYFIHVTEKCERRLGFKDLLVVRDRRISKLRRRVIKAKGIGL